MTFKSTSRWSKRDVKNSKKRIFVLYIILKALIKKKKVLLPRRSDELERTALVRILSKKEAFFSLDNFTLLNSILIGYADTSIACIY
jgi:hypothetical protein